MRLTNFLIVFIACFTLSMCYSVQKRAIPVVPIRENDTPIIGVLTQEVSNLSKKKFGSHFTSYIAASYVKFVEGAGARAVPLWIGKPREFYEEIMSKINGVLLPGGATFFNQSNGYADAGKHIYDVAVEMNNKGIYMPVWGTCLGFELLTYVAAGGKDHRTDCSSHGQTLPLEFKPDFQSSKMFKNAPESIINVLKTEPVTYNYHMFCTTEKSLEDFGLDKEWRVMSTNHDWNGDEFVSTIEHKKYPFYGIQFHPEKNTYEWALNKNLTHTKNAVAVTQYFADFLVDEARKNGNSFETREEEYNSLIYNFQPIFSAKQKSTFYQMYLFGPEDNYSGKSGASRNIMQIFIMITALCMLAKL